ncbi:hypothetical protein [Nonomuraea typhae]|uniref:hypothetical protein n=1 Tax=Nonomuraea typhae TaxID=2603600 RepID=UPI0012F86032|nr:hypothetical protein [Nonomuraea typhae]
MKASTVAHVMTVLALAILGVTFWLLLNLVVEPSWPNAAFLVVGGAATGFFVRSALAWRRAAARGAK